jgi:hypothetical protein
MADLPNRDKLEATLKRVVNKAFRPHRKSKTRRMPPWAKIRDALYKDLHPKIERVRIEAARAFAAAHGDGPLPADFELTPDNRVANLVADMVDWSRSEWLSMKKPRTKADILAWRKKHLGTERAARIAATELTMAQSKGELQALKHYREQGANQVQGIWNTVEDACAICSPLHRKPENVWRATFPGGPPGHVNCRCYLTYEKPGKSKQKALG